MRQIRENARSPAVLRGRGLDAYQGVGNPDRGILRVLKPAQLTAAEGPGRPGHGRSIDAQTMARFSIEMYTRTCWDAGWISCSYFKMLTARATTSTPMPRDTVASIIISSLAHRLIAETSVGLNAVAVQKASDR